MLSPITIRYAFRPITRSVATGRVSDLFGLPEQEPPHTIAENLALDVREGDIVLFTGPSGSGKSSLLREAARQLGAIDIANLELPALPLIDALEGALEDRLALLAACGLSEARLMLRTPAELSDGQRYRFRIAHAMNRPQGKFVVLDEFTAALDRTLAKVVAFNLRKLASRTGVGLLAATTHEDIAADLQPDLHVRCRGEGEMEITERGCVIAPGERDSSHAGLKKNISIAADFWLSEGSSADWPYFARWHYRGHHLAFTRRVILLWHGDEPIGICIFASPAASLTLRSKYFRLRNPRRGVALAALNSQLWLLQRVVIHPTYRGAGIAAAFVRRACELCDIDWIETLSAMGQANPFFERAGFIRIGIIRKSGRTTARHAAYGLRCRTTSTEPTHLFSEPVYYIRDNRRRESYNKSS